MNIRELLQIGILSNKKSRRILVGFGIVVVSLFVGFRVPQVLQRSWLTPGERDAGRAALAKIDSLQNLESISLEDFDARENGLAEKLKMVSDEAWTQRDESVYCQLWLYRRITEPDRRSEKQIQQSDPSAVKPQLAIN